ncbi:MAG: TadE/TadG family type IV pilus assembly protein [Reyranella sp.]
MPAGDGARVELRRKFQRLWNFTTVTTETIQRLKNLEDRLQGACVRNFLDKQSSVRRFLKMRSLFCCMLKNDDGVSAIEFAIISPVLLLIVTGIFKFGVAMNHSLSLTNAVAQGALTLALSRGTTTPYSSTTGAIGAAAPNLVPAQTTITVKINGTACTSDATCVTLMVAGQTAVVKATYPCDLTVMGHNYASSGCNLTAQTAQMIQ